MRFANFLLGAAAALFIGGAASAATVKVTFEGNLSNIGQFGLTQSSVWVIKGRLQPGVAFGDVSEK